MPASLNGVQHPRPSHAAGAALQHTPQAYTPGYTGPYDCVDPFTGASTCDNYAYPFGDKLVNNEGMKSADAYAPFPNALLLNWATIFTLGLGNLCALDFQVSG